SGLDFPAHLSIPPERLRNIFPATASPIEAAERVGQIALQSDVSVVRQQALGLAQEYERIRATMSSGDSRTRKMEIVTTRMKALAPVIYALLPERAQSDTPGQRLVAVTILQGVPTAEYLGWLADRLAKDRPFIGCKRSGSHAAFLRFTEGADSASGSRDGD